MPSPVNYVDPTGHMAAHDSGGSSSVGLVYIVPNPESEEEGGTELSINLADPSNPNDNPEEYEHWSDGGFDMHGYLLLRHYLEGGKDLNINSDYWGNYMRNNKVLSWKIENMLREIYAEIDFNKVYYVDGTTQMSIENGESINGYQYLHGTDASVGGFHYQGTITKDRYSDLQAELTLNWNDIIDPNPKYSTDRFKSKIAEFITLGRADAYNISITWEQSFTIP